MSVTVTPHLKKVHCLKDQLATAININFTSKNSELLDICFDKFGTLATLKCVAEK